MGLSVRASAYSCNDPCLLQGPFALHGTIQQGGDQLKHHTGLDWTPTLFSRIHTQVAQIQWEVSFYPSPTHPPLPIHSTPPLTSFLLSLLQNSRTSTYPTRFQFPNHLERLCIIKKKAPRRGSTLGLHPIITPLYNLRVPSLLLPPTFFFSFLSLSSLLYFRVL